MESEAVRLFLEQTKRSQLPLLSAALDVALTDGWRFLRKEQYNLLATLMRLVTELDGLQPQPLSQGYASPSRRLFGIEIAFFTFISYRDAPAVGKDRLFGLEELLPKLSYPEKEGAEALAAGNLLLKNGGPPPCLQDFILALNMVRSRRYLTIADLLRPEGEALVSATEFDCGDDVQDAIDEHVASLLAALRFQEPTIGATLKNERQAEDQRRSMLEEIERIADGPTYRIARGKANPSISDEA